MVLNKEIGSDAIRFFLAQNQANSHLDFDLSLAKAQNAENPVYYIQYAHARMNSILKKIDNLEEVSNSFDNTLLVLNKYERNLIASNQIFLLVKNSADQKLFDPESFPFE